MVHPLVGQVDVTPRMVVVDVAQPHFQSVGIGEETAFGVTVGDAHIRMEVTDNGHSDYSEENAGERIEKGFGLKKLTSYAQRCGGSTEFFNRDGFFAAIELPVRTARESE